MTAQDVLACLNQRFAAPEWAFASELSLIPGFIRGRRADAVALNCWASGKWALAFLGLEIKISRSDFLHELKNPHKRRETYVDVDGVFFATPKGLVKKEEVPADCGLIECWTKTTDGQTTYSTRVQKYPEGFRLPMDLMLGNASVNLDKAPALSRAVAVSMIRGFDPDRINENSNRDAWNAKIEIKSLKRELGLAKFRAEQAEAKLKTLEPT